MTAVNRNAPRLTIIVIATALAAGISSTAQAFSVTNWDLLVNVWDGTTLESSSHDFRSVQDPFVNQHSVALANGLTTAAAQYNISWLLDNGSFNISAQLAAQDGHSVQSVASGTVYIHTDVELFIHLGAAFGYNLPGSGQTASAGFSATDRDTEETILYDLNVYDTDISPPAQGTLTLSGDAVLPAGRNYRLQYSMQLLTGGSSSTLAQGSGSLSFQLSPEPATLALLVPLLLALPRRSARRRATSP